MYNSATGQLEREFDREIPASISNDGIRVAFDDGAKRGSCAFSSDGSFHVRGRATLSIPGRNADFGRNKRMMVSFDDNGLHIFHNLDIIDAFAAANLPLTIAQACLINKFQQRIPLTAEEQQQIDALPQGIRDVLEANQQRQQPPAPNAIKRSTHRPDRRQRPSAASARPTPQSSRWQSFKTRLSRIWPWSNTHVVQPAINILRRCKTTLIFFLML